MSTIEDAAAGQKTWADVQKAQAAAAAAGPAADPSASTQSGVSAAIAVAEAPDPKQPLAQQAAGQTAPVRSSATTILPARHAGFLVVDGGATSTEILACCSTADEAVTWAANRLKTHQFAPLPAA